VLDLRLEKSIRVRTQKVALRLNLYNAANVNTITSLTQQSGPNFLRASNIVPPRTAEVSMQYSF
jgi:hypothetical protein